MLPMGNHKQQGGPLPWYIRRGRFMGWMIAIGTAVFLVTVFFVILSLCMAAGAEEDDAEQLEWLREQEEKRRKRKSR